MDMSSSGRSNNKPTLRFDDGAVQFRQRIVVSILSHKSLLLRNIRSNSQLDSHEAAAEGFGLQAHEASFLRLIDEMTNGSHIEINASGTQLLFKPGVLLGGTIHHECPVETTANGGIVNLEGIKNARSIGWFIEGILPLAPFGKEPLQLHLTGITDGTSTIDPSCDYLRATVLPLMSQFGIGEPTGKGRSDKTDTSLMEKDAMYGMEIPSIQVLRRGAAPAGGGSVSLYCPVVRSTLRPLDYTDAGKFKRVRGTAITTKLISSSLAARVAYSAKGVLHKMLPDVWIHTDNHTMKQHGCGPSPSLSLLLAAESTTGVVIGAEVCLDTSIGMSDPASATENEGGRRRELPEDLGVRGAIALLEEIRRGGCVDTGLQSLVLLWMCLTPEDVSRIRIGSLSPYTIESLRLFHKAFGVEFKCRADQESKTVLLSCLGTGYKNMARAST